MSSGMNVEEAKEVAAHMSYSQAVHNALNAKCVPYRKATKIKLLELLEIAKRLDAENELITNTESRDSSSNTIFCPGCGNAIPFISNECPNCGMSL